MDRTTKTLAIALEALGCFIVVAGITVEAVMKADLGFMLITGGSALIAGGSLLFAKLIRKK